MSTSTSHLFPYYQQELAALRELGADFARAYPKVAGRLDLGPDVSADPQVERLLESVAFLTARIQRTIDSDFGLLPESLLGILYPHFIAPVPSMAIAQVEADPAQGALSTGYPVPRGTRLFAETDRGHLCWFRTTAPLTLWPLRCQGVRLTGVDAVASPLIADAGAASLLHVRLHVTGRQPLDALPIETLRFHVGGDPTSAPMLFSLLDARCAAVLVRDGEGTIRRLPQARWQAVGFADVEAALPDPLTGHPAWRLAQEMAAFPEKFLFLDLTGLAGTLRGSHCDLLFCLSDPPPAGLKVDDTSMRLGCVPVINLFPRTTEPLRLTHDRYEYRLLPDARFDESTEIHTVLSLSASTDPRDDTTVLTPLFSYEHGVGGSARNWYLTRRVAAERPGVSGTDMMVSFVDLDFSPTEPDPRTLYAHTLCTNRGLAADLGAGANLYVEGALPGLTFSLLRRPTAQLTPPMQGETLWRLVSSLSLSHLVLADDARSLAALKEVLALVLPPGAGSDFPRDVAALQAVEVVRTVLRQPPDMYHPAGFLPGLHVRLTFAGEGAGSGSRYLLASVLDRVVALLAGVNAMTQVSLRFSGAAEGSRPDQDWRTWPPRAGTHPML